MLQSAPHIILVLLFFTCTNIFGQGNCDPPISQIDLKVNNVKARLLTGGDFWWDGHDGLYIVPNTEPGTSPVSSLFGGALWMGGFDADGNLKLAAQTYGRSAGYFDYFTGPISSGPNATNNETCNNWDKFFEITAESVALHKADLADNGTIDGPVPPSILGWPARGNADFFDIHQFELPDQELAPFFDQNENGIYEAMLGDYPLVKGDQSVWWIYNDAGNAHTDSGAGDQTLGMEIHANAFAYSSDTAYINNTTFYDFKLTLKRDQPLHDVYIGLWVDPNLGCNLDDYVGCSPEEKLAFVYNGDDFDDNPCSGNTNGYEDSIPVVAIKVLNSLTSQDGEEAPFAHFTYYLNGTTPGALPGTFDPNTPQEYYNYLTGHWRDGTPFSQGGTGYNPGQPAYPYAFDGSEVDGQAWTECNANTLPADRRFLMSFGPINMEQGDSRELSFAVVWKANQDYPCPDPAIIAEEANLVEDFYIRQCEAMLVSSYEEAIPTTEVLVYPNPVDKTTSITLESHDSNLEKVLIYSANGRLVKHFQQINASKIQVPQNGLTSGIYFYQAYLENGQIARGKLVVE